MTIQDPIGLQSATANADWWRGAVIYQIYPRSFQDSNGDGVGDLAGITQRLAYVASLGVDAIWISPFFTSPMADYGYDVADYCGVDPLFGTLADFDALMSRAHELGLKVIIDQVFSHSSDQHPWFVESRSSRDNPRADWYVWADPQPDGTPPNNWLSIFGGSAWAWDARRCQYYLHNFLTSQPDLNFHNPEVQEALFDVARFWLDRGVDGFRLDTINFYFADKDLRSNPPLPAEMRNDSIAPSVNPYNHQNHIYSKNRPENLDFLRQLREVMDEYPGRTIVGEVGDAQRGLEILGEYTTGDDLAHMCYAFEMLAKDPLTAERFADVMTKVADVATEGWACWAFSNHDVARHRSRWSLNDAATATYATLLMCNRGSACIYQGEELGLSEADIPFDALQDPYGIEFWPEFKGRDGCRTPMVWENSNTHGGFSEATPWLPVSQDHQSSAVQVQDSDPASLLNHYRRAIMFRKSQVALEKGDFGSLSVAGTVVSFERSWGTDRLFLAFNLSGEPAEIAAPDGEWTVVGKDLGSVAPNSDGKIALAGWDVSLLKLA